MASDSPIHYSIVVPFYNEQENIPPLYMKLTEVMDGIGEPYELVFVDDGSKDDSFKVLAEIYEHDRRVNLVRQRPSRAANWMMAKLSGIELHDFGTTFKAYRREIIQEIQLYGELHRFIPALASSTGARITEVPITDGERKSGKSNYGIGRTIRVFLDLMIVKFLLDYSTRPLQFFGLIGVGGTFLGMLLAGYLAFEKFAHGISVMAQHGPLMLLAVALFVSGVQFVSMGLLGELIARTYYESQNKPVYALREVKSHRKDVGDTEQTRPSGSSER